MNYNLYNCIAEISHALILNIINISIQKNQNKILNKIKDVLEQT